MYKYVTGNILESTCECLVNPVNTVGVMGAGLAKQFKLEYPHMYESYVRACKDNSLKIGQLLFYNGTEDEKIICLFPTKIDWRQPSDIEYVELGLKSFVNHYKITSAQSFAFPKLGCGLGGLDWDYEVKPIMEYYLSNLDVDIDIYV